MLAFGLLEVAVGLAPTYELMALLLVPTGVAVLTFTTTANAIVQLGSAPHVRGRVMALYVLVFLGGTPLGSPVVGALASARRSGPPRQRTLFASVLAFGLLEVAVGLAPSFALMAVLLVPTGIATLTFTTTANSIVQLGSAPEVRGRVMALYVLVFLGGTPVGAPLIGALAEAFGPRSSIVLGGAVVAVSGVVAAVVMTRVRHLRLEPHLVRRRPHVHVRRLGLE